MPLSKVNKNPETIASAKNTKSKAPKIFPVGSDNKKTKTSSGTSTEEKSKAAPKKPFFDHPKPKDLKKSEKKPEQCADEEKTDIKSVKKGKEKNDEEITSSTDKNCDIKSKVTKTAQLSDKENYNIENKNEENKHKQSADDFKNGAMENKAEEIKQSLDANKSCDLEKKTDVINPALTGKSASKVSAKSTVNRVTDDVKKVKNKKSFVAPTSKSDIVLKKDAVERKTEDENKSIIDKADESENTYTAPISADSIVPVLDTEEDEDMTLDFETVKLDTQKTDVVSEICAGAAVGDDSDFDFEE